MGLILFVVAYLLLFPMTIVNYFFVEHKRGYFKSTAINIDKFANREFRAFWNSTMRLKNGYEFGNENETLSSALGKNEIKKTLSNFGKFIVWVLDKIDKNHCKKSIDEILE